MKLNFAKAAAAATIAAAALIFVPTATQAATYTPAETGTLSATTVAPGGVVAFGAAGGTFTPGENVVVTISGENASGASLATVKFAHESKVIWSGKAGASGGLEPISIRIPANASGEYTIIAVGESGKSTVPVTVTVTSTGQAGAALPSTGMDSGSLLGIWIGGGALLLVGGGLAVAGTVRRNRKIAA